MQLDDVDAEVDEVVEPLDRRVERALGGERADVQLVDDARRRARTPAQPASDQANAGGSNDAPTARADPSGSRGARGSGRGSPPSRLNA